jgi:hypothetical protein
MPGQPVVLIQPERTIVVAYKGINPLLGFPVLLYFSPSTIFS